MLKSSSPSDGAYGNADGPGVEADTQGLPVNKSYPPGVAPFTLSVQELNEANEEKDSAWLAKKGGSGGLAKLLLSDAHSGLNPDSSPPGASLDDRAAVYGANKFKEVPPKGFFHLWFEAMKDPIIILLIVAALISTILGVAVPEERHDNAWSEGVAIWVAVFVVTLVAATQDWHKERQFQKLNQQNNVLEVKVLRGGVSGIMTSTDLIVGDVLLLDTGDKIVADCVYVTGHNLIIDESSLTGEADPIKKSDKDPWLRSGTTVTEGSGRALVVAVGPNSEWGKTLALVVRESDNTPLQDKLEDLAKLIGKVGLFFAIVCFVALLIRWCIMEGGFPLSEFAEGPLKFFMFSVTIVVVAVPEGLPLAVTLSLAYSMKKMMKDNNFVRQLAACETMGGATAICSDKTGTLTENRMTVVEGWFCGKRHVDLPDGADLPPFLRRDIELNCAMNSKAFLTVPEGGGPIEFAGNRTECALLMMLRTWGTSYQDLRNKHEADVVSLYGFTSERKMASVLLVNSQGATPYRLYNKGASEIVVGRCTHWIDPSGGRAEFTDETRRQLLNSVTAMASCGLRTLGLAYRDLQIATPDGAPPPEDDMTLLCVVGIKDPVRPEVPQAVLTCQEAGICVRMVTGDNIHTARHIARECGILTNGGIAMEGPKFRTMPEEELIPLLPRLQVLARSSPQDKHTLVNLLKRQGEVVGVTGDGTNDAPALKEADVGLAMGIAGTEVAKEAADIVILDDNFNSIVKSVLWGRNTFASIRKFLQFQLTVNVVALVVSFVSAVTDGAMPLNVLQLLWVNLIMDAMGALALATELPNERLLRERPHGRDEALINGRMMKHILTQGLYQMFWCFLIFYGVPRWFSDYKLPSQCEYFGSAEKSGTGYNLCCTTGVDCFTDEGGIYQPGQTPICTYEPDGGCDVEEPDDDASQQLHDWYDTADKAYTRARDDAHKNTNSVVFNAFIFCQIFNMINCRKINDELNVFENIFHSPLFWVMAFIMCAAQVLIVELLPGVFKIERQNWAEWLIAVAIGAGSLLVSVLVKLLTRGWHKLVPPGTLKAKATEMVPRFGRRHRNVSKQSEVSIPVSANSIREEEEEEAPVGLATIPSIGLAADEAPAGTNGPVFTKSGSKGSRRWAGAVGEAGEAGARLLQSPSGRMLEQSPSGRRVRVLSKSGSKGSGRWEAPPGAFWDEESFGSKRWESGKHGKGE